MQFGNGTLRLTTRQTYQLHAVLKQDLKTVFSTVIKNMGTTLGACGDVNRNVLAPPVGFIYPSHTRQIDFVSAGVLLGMHLAPLLLFTAVLQCFCRHEIDINTFSDVALPFEAKSGGRRRLPCT